MHSTMPTSAPSIARQLTAFLAVPPAPFSWRDANCCHWAAAWVRQATGHDPMAGLAATPDARAALRLLAGLGGSLRAAWSRQLGREPVAPQLAQLGDVVLVELAEGLRQPGAPGALMGICVGRQVAVADASGAVRMLPLAAADAAWRLTELRPC